MSSARTLRTIAALAIAACAAAAFSGPAAANEPGTGRSADVKIASPAAGLRSAPSGRTKGGSATKTTSGSLSTAASESFTTQATVQATVPGSAFPEGSFVAYNGRVFRIVGGATLYVSSWTWFGGAKPVTTITTQQYLNTYQFPWDGTFVKDARDGRVYRFVAGAPIYVATWAAFGGKVQPSITIDPNDLVNAGKPFPWDGVAPFTLDYDGDGTPPVFVRGGQTGRVYKMTGGAPMYLPSWAPYGGVQPAITVDQYAIDNSGATTGAYRFLQFYPLDGWPIRSPQTGEVYIVAGGAPIYVSNPAVLTDPPAALDGRYIGWAGTAPYNHLRWTPLDNTFIRGVSTGRIYQVTGGVPTYVSSWDTIPGGRQPTTNVDDLAIQNAGGPGHWSHLLAPTP